MLPTCRTVVVRHDGRSTLSISEKLLISRIGVVSPGTYIAPGLRVSACQPSPCVATPQTQYEFALDADVKVTELGKEVEVVVRYATGRGGYTESLYVYPSDVWGKVSMTVEPLAGGEAPREPALILIGPPGTGKSSMLSIIVDMLGLPSIEVVPENVLSLWLGQSEQNMAAKFAEAEERAPSILLFDEAEWIIGKSSVSQHRNVETVMGNMKTILKRRIDEFGKRKLPVLAVFASNIAEEDIDDYMRRSGRAYRPIIVGLPSYDAVKRVIERLYPQLSGEASRLATTIVNAGLSMADALRVLRDYVETGVLRIEAMRQRGYSRLVLPLTSHSEKIEELAKNLGEKLYLEKAGRYRRLRVWVKGAPEAMAPLSALAIMVWGKTQTIYIEDEHYIDEAIDMARSLQATIIINTETLTPATMRRLAGMRIPILAVGEEKPPGHWVIAHITSIPPHLVEAAIVAVATINNIEITDKDIEAMAAKARTMRDTELIKSLTAIALTGTTTSFRTNIEIIGPG